jgi:hypothetical protein
MMSLKADQQGMCDFIMFSLLCNFTWGGVLLALELSLHLEPLLQLFALGIFKIGSRELFPLAGFKPQVS